MNQWQPIESAPKDETHVLIYAKRWNADRDTFEHRMFFDCHFWPQCDGITPTTHGNKGWMNVEKGWFMTHWYPIPEPPQEARNEGK